MNPRVETRINELEAKLTLADDQLDQLNRVVFRQQEQMDRLQAQLRWLMQHVQSVQSEEAFSATEQRDLRDEIPPHY